MLRVASFARIASREDSFANRESISTVSEIEFYQRRIGTNHGLYPADL